jgi:hypothetical protein
MVRWYALFLKPCYFSILIFLREQDLTSIRSRLTFQINVPSTRRSTLSAMAADILILVPMHSGKRFTMLYVFLAS